MTPEKKKVLERILDALIPYWDLAEGFLLLLKEGGNEGLEENLYQIILREIRNINSSTQKENIKNIKIALEKLKEKTEKTTKLEEKEAEEMLNDFINNLG